MILKPYKHQAEEFNKHRADDARALLWQMRTGKTKAIIDDACHLYLSLEIRGVLIIAPNNIHRQWIEQEIPKHQWKGIRSVGTSWRFSDRQTGEKFQDLLHLMASHTEYFGWFAVNMESLIRLEVKKAIAAFIKVCKNQIMVVYDESHHFARPGAKRTAIARGIARKAAYRRILSGTESENSPLQSFSQYELLEKAALGFETYGAFKNRYAIYEQMGWGRNAFPKLTGYQNLEELKERKAKFTSVVLRSDCEDLPPLQLDRRLVEMMPAQAKLWKDIKNNEIEALESLKQQSSLTGGAALVKLQQIEGGYWKQADGCVKNLCNDNSNPKMLVLLDELECYSGLSVVWFQFVHELEAAYRIMIDKGIKTGRYHGKAKDRDTDLRNFQRERLTVLLGQPQAGGEGRQMPAGKIVWYSNTPDAIVRSQAAERATIMGGKSVQMVDIVVPGGVDDYFLQLTGKKTKLADDMSRHGIQKILSGLLT